MWLRLRLRSLPLAAAFAEAFAFGPCKAQDFHFDPAFVLAINLGGINSSLLGQWLLRGAATVLCWDNGY